ncbi:hypothetical protein ACHAXA_006080 [Cyclostephanos tholiformis]|uniref:Uncharacterized protein n=1 Tax=Cyclostephanos tholiformis TaxID=382380 RepID=A0ABD3SAY2_9STRA
MSEAATATQSVQNPHPTITNDRRVGFAPVDFGRNFSCDSSSDASSSINIATHTGQVKDLGALSPKLRSFFRLNGNKAIQDIDERYPMGLSTSRKNNAFLPSHLLDESTSDGSSISILHNIFSPKFHAKSVKKKGRPKHGQREHQKQQQNHHSIFSPVSATSTPGRGHDDANASAISDMSDDFSTIRAILRGDTLDNIKRTVGLDGVNHPLNLSDSGDRSNTSSKIVEDELRNQNVEDKLGSKVVNNPTNADMGCTNNMQCRHQSNYADHIIDDSTEVMIDTARLLASQAVKTNVHHDPNAFHDGIRCQPLVFAGSHETKTKTTKKSPKASLVTSSDEFYIPTSTIKHRGAHHGAVQPFPSNQTVLPPVWEEEDGKTNDDHGSPYQNDDRDHLRHNNATYMTDDSIDVRDFLTPKQHGDNCYEEDDEEEFFSPLAQYSGHTPSKKHAACNSNDIMNTEVSSLTAIDFNNYENLANKCVNVTATMPPAATTRLVERVDTPSSRIPVMAEETNVVADRLYKLTPPEKSPNSYGCNPSNVSASVFHPGSPQNASALNSPASFHLHSPSVSNLSPNALTVDFVKSCNCIETLKSILCILSDDNKFTSHRYNGKRGKQLRYPSLVRLVEKKLQNLQMEISMRDPNEEHLKVQPVQWLPRVGARGKVFLHQDNDGSDKENVDPHNLRNQDGRAAMEEITRDYHLPMQSFTILHDSNGVGEENFSNPDQNGSSSMTNRSISMMSKSSLDMNLSESMLFGLDDESHYWKQGTDDPVVNCKEEIGEDMNSMAVERIEDMKPKTDDEDNILELKNMLTAALSSNARLLSEVNSLVDKQKNIKAELSTKLECMVKQLSQQQDAAASENTANRGQIAELKNTNFTLLEEIQGLNQQLHLVNQKAEKTSLKLHAEIENAKMKCSSLSHEKQILEKKLEKFLLDKKALAPEIKNAEKMYHLLESSKLANKALAKALAVSEHDLAEANGAKEKIERECYSLRHNVAKLEDKVAFLSSKAKEMSAELKSSRAYIDKLYADLEMKQFSSNELKNDFERRELEWKNLEQGYSQRIHELETKIGSDSNHKVSMDAYMAVIKQTRHYKIESMKNQQTIDSLKERLSVKEQCEMVQKPSATNSSEKTASLSNLTQRALQNIVVPKVSPSNNGAKQQMMTKLDTQHGKQLNRVAVIRAAGGRKGLSEQLKRARGVSAKENDTPKCTT